MSWQFHKGSRLRRSRLDGSRERHWLQKNKRESWETTAWDKLSLSQPNFGRKTRRLWHFRSFFAVRPVEHLFAARASELRWVQVQTVTTWKNVATLVYLSIRRRSRITFADVAAAPFQVLLFICSISLSARLHIAMYMSMLCFWNTLLTNISYSGLKKTNLFLLVFFLQKVWAFSTEYII